MTRFVIPRNVLVLIALTQALVAGPGCSGSSAEDVGLRLDGLAWEMVFGNDPGATDVGGGADASDEGTGRPDPTLPDVPGSDGLDGPGGDVTDGGADSGIGPDAGADAADGVAPAEPAPEALEPAPEPAHDVAEPTPDVLSADTPDASPEATADAGPEVVACPGDCDDGQACTADTCQANGTCVHAPLPNGSPCDDGDVCTSGDACLSGLCFASALVACDDGDPCSTDACAPPEGCTHAPATGPACDDGNACTGGDRCETGKCQGGATNLCPTCGDGPCEAPLETCSTCADDCGPCNETTCGDGVDEDGDGQTDCDDIDCAGDAACPVTCTVDADLTCGKSEYDTAWGNDLSGYSCGTEDGSGSDGIYRFVSATGGYVTVWVTAQNDKDRYDVYLLSASCSPAACTDFEEDIWSDKSVSFSAEPGVPYYVVVERVTGPGGPYIVKPTCY